MEGLKSFEQPEFEYTLFDRNKPGHQKVFSCMAPDPDIAHDLYIEHCKENNIEPAEREDLSIITL
jgi:hypothetical protein